jgi:hypothetical protein
MHKRVGIARPERRMPPLQRVVGVLPRPTTQLDSMTRREQAPFKSSPTSSTNFQIDPYLDYGRFLTTEGGILIIYKDLDLRWRHIIWRLSAWTSFTGAEADYAFKLLPTPNPWLVIAVILTVAIINWLIVTKPVELYRRIEIRPDCMIVEGSDVFWARFIEGGLPSCRPDTKDNQIFCGIYGTRFVEYLTIRRFDENDRMPEVMAAHLQDAMHQLWMRPH